MAYFQHNTGRYNSSVMSSQFAMSPKNKLPICSFAKITITTHNFISPIISTIF